MLRSFALLLLLPAVALAQTAEVVKKVDAKLDAERAAQRNEDVEILRRLLNRAAGLPDKVQVSVESPARTNPNDPAPPFSMMTDQYMPIWNERMKEWEARNPLKPGAIKVSSPVGPFDGVYLPGAGVVYTLHVPAGTPRTLDGDRVGLNSSCSTCHRNQVTVHTSPPLLDVTKGEPTLSDWDRVKQDVRGEPAKPADKPKADKPRAAVCEPGSLEGLIAGVLAANAKHVRHLPEKEGITVVVTFDEVKPGGKPTVWSVDPNALPEDVEVFSGYKQLPKEPWTPPAKPGFTPDEVKALNLGDLHLKQGKHKEAAEAYATALARFTDKELMLSGLSKLTAEQRNAYADELQKGVRDAMKSYAKALLLADQPDKAKWALEMATGFVVLEVTPTTVPASSTAPAKLILSVTKADVDAAKDAAAVKKAVKAERLNFPK